VTKFDFANCFAPQCVCVCVCVLQRGSVSPSLRTQCTQCKTHCAKRYCGRGTAQMETPAAAPGVAWLWKARRVHGIQGTAQRNEMFALWKSGRLTGLFNLPSLVCCASALWRT